MRESLPPKVGYNRPVVSETAAVTRRLEFPDVYVILTAFLLLAAAMTWLVPAGAYERETLPNGRERVVAGSYHAVEPSPVGFMELVTAIPRGLSEASSVVFLTLLVGGSVGVLRRIGTIDLGIHHVKRRLGGRVELLIPALMTSFAVVAAFIGAPELALAYLPIVLPLMLRLGYDTVTATALVLLSTTLGYAFGITAPSTIGLGHLLAGLPLYSGAWFRTFSFVAVQALAIVFVMRHARKVKGAPERAPNREQDERLRAVLGPEVSPPDGTRERRAAVAAAAMFVAIIASVLRFALGFDEISGLFVVTALVTSLLLGRRLNQLCDDFNASFREMLTGALIVGVARGVSVVLEDGLVIDTLVFHLAATVESLPASLTAVGVLGTQTAFNFLVPSGSGQSLLTLPDPPPARRPRRADPAGRRARDPLGRRHQQHPLPDVGLLHGDPRAREGALRDVGPLLPPLVRHRPRARRRRTRHGTGDIARTLLESKDDRDPNPPSYARAHDRRSLRAVR